MSVEDKIAIGISMISIILNIAFIIMNHYYDKGCHL